MRCPNCGTENEDGVRFCKGCGSEMRTPAGNRGASPNYSTFIFNFQYVLIIVLI